jgi:hypothetical protein
MRCSPPDLCNVLDLVPDATQKIRVEDRRSVFIRKHPFLGIENFSAGQRLFLPLRAEFLEFRRKLRAKYSRNKVPLVGESDRSGASRTSYKYELCKFRG